MPPPRFFRLTSDGPNPPPKDPLLTPPYKSFFSRSSSSLIPATPSPSPSIEGTDSSCSNTGLYLLNAASSSSYTMGQPTPKKGVFKLASLARRNRSRKDLSDTASASGRSTTLSEHGSATGTLEGDEGITLPWNFQHHIHVDEGYIGLPPSWSAALSQVGFADDEIAAIHARRRAAATGLALDTKLASPSDFPPSPRSLAVTPQTACSSATLLDPAPRSTSLGIHPSAFYSTPASSPKAPSFSIKSFVSGIKSTLTSDSASTKEGTGEESEQYVFVNGDTPDQADRVTGDETSIEPCSYDTSSIHTRTRQPSQEHTPRTPTFPQIQVQPAQSDAGRVSLPSSSSAPRAPSPLAHSTSLPLSARALSASSSSGPRSGPASAPPRTPPRRLYHVANASEDFFDEPPPAYASPKGKGIIPLKEKEGLGVAAVSTEYNLDGPSGTSNHDSRVEDQEASISDTPGLSADDMSGTADDVLDISSCYSDDAVHGGDAETEPIQQARALSPSPPLAIDKRTSKLTTLPPRISLHQDSLDDWSESLFSVIGSKGKRASILMNGNATTLKQERRTTIRPRSPPSGVAALAMARSDISFGALGTDARATIIAVDEEDEQENKVAPTTTESPLLPKASPNLDPPASASPLPSESPRRASIDSTPPSPPPKPKPKPKPLVLPPPIALAPPKMNVITGISGKSPVNSLFGARPQPLPIPIPLSQIRAQLRPAPPKPPHPAPTLPLPPLKRIPSQPSLLSPQVTSPQKAFKHDLNAPASDSRPTSSQTLLPGRANPGDRDSDLSTITVTPATIAKAKTEVVRTAVASVVDSDTVSLTSKRESVVVSAADAEPQTLAYGGLDTCGGSPRTQERKEASNDSTASKTSSASLLRDGPQSKWPAPPPPPVELDTDSAPRRVSRFRTTSLGRIHAMSGPAISPISSHSSHSSSDTTSGSTSESTPPQASSPKTNGHLAPETRFLQSTTGTFGGVDVDEETGEGSEALSPETPLSTSRTSMPPVGHPLLAQLQPYIMPRNPTSYFTNLVEIAEGESGSVYAARVSPSFAEKDGAERPIPSNTSHVAIKRIPLPPMTSSPSLSDDSPVSNKLVSVLHELSVLKNLDHEHLLLLDAIYVCSAEDSALDTSLWIRMELMERSLADVIGLVAVGLALQERLIGRFASDILRGLDYLQRQHIAHRDVRSDNLLVNAAGVVKLADFSNAVRVERNAPTVTGAVGVIYWQAPEMRAGPYNALKVDIWSLGATVWELAETIPPFSTPASPSTQMSFAIQTARRIGSQWPPLSHPEHYSRPFHEFLRLCGRESAGRPSPGELLNTSFIRNACGRPVILQLLSQCRSIEEAMAGKDAPVAPSP